MLKTASRDEIAGEIRAALARSQVRQSELAAAIGMSQAALSDRLRGNRAFDTDQVTKIADYLGLDLIELFTRRGAA
jgi:transcriptional regulator with XRE-family HTH domain